MSLSDKTTKEIKAIIQKFITENGFTKSEENVQTSYTIKILELLGWDSSMYKINTSQEVKTGNKPDILLKGSGGGTIFIVESKAPKQSLDGKYINKSFTEQTCEYCNSEGIYWGILTNFIEWRIYNSYTKDIYYDKKYFTIVDDKVNDDVELFQFFDKISFENLNNRKGKIDLNPLYYKKQDEIKDEFFDNLKDWRQALRAYLYKYSEHKTSESLNKVEKLTQKILDRMIFIQVCYGKNIISYDILGSILYSKKNKFEELKSKFKELDEKFNSELFADDEDIDSLEINYIPMEGIIRGINNIDFSKLSVHIIGEVYENYLGELLKRRKESVKLDESKERAKRKEQGIYYTPDYIVNYIVENTLGEILKNCKTQEEIQKIRVLDPACGSGSFLIRAFDEFYAAYERVPASVIPSPIVIPAKAGIQQSKTQATQTKSVIQRSLFDDFEIKKKILLYNLYGVDLDERAVDIAKLNLLIKALEGTTDASLEGKRKLLPNLNLNIRCGNSLVSGKSLKDSGGEGLFDNTEQFNKDINILLDLKEKFRKASEDSEKGKYLNDIYVLEEKINSSLNGDLKNYFKNIDEIKPFNYEVAFCEIFKDGGFDCVIGNPPWVSLKGKFGNKILSNVELSYFFKTYESNTYMPNLYEFFVWKSLKIIKENGFYSMIVPDRLSFNNQFIKLRKYILENYVILNLQYKAKFPFVIVDTLIFNIKKSRNINNTLKIGEFGKKSQIKKQKDFFKNIGYSFNYEDDNLIFKCLNKIESIPKKILISEAFLTTSGFGGKSDIFTISKKNKNQIETIKGKNIQRYFLNGKLFFDFKKENITGRTTNIDILGAKEKILIRKTGYPLYATFDNTGIFPDQSLYFLYGKKTKESYLYYLGIINSRLFMFYYWNKLVTNRDTTPQLKKIHLDIFPFPVIDFNNKTEKSLHDKLVKLVDEMIMLNKNPEKNDIKIKAKDKEIDDLVYKLYDITDEERKIIEDK